MVVNEAFIQGTSITYCITVQKQQHCWIWGQIYKLSNNLFFQILTSKTQII